MRPPLAALRAAAAAARRFSSDATTVAARRLSSDATKGGWPKPESPEWLSLRRRPESASRDFFGIPADDDDARPLEVQTAEAAEKKRHAAAMAATAAADARRAAEKAAEKAAEARFDAAQRTNGSLVPPPNQLAHAHPAVAARSPEPEKPQLSPRVQKLLKFDMTPSDVKAALDEKVVGQERAKRAISVAVAEHYHNARRCVEDPSRKDRHWHKKNVLLVGPSGCGKTQLCRALAEIAGAAYVKADATQFSATGFVGRDVDDVVAQLLDAAGGDETAAAFGVVHVDEVDKVAERPGGLLGGGGGSVNTRDVQTALLKLMEDAELPLPAPARGRGGSGGARSGKTFSTKHVLFVFSGAFEGSPAQLPADSRGTVYPEQLVNAGLLHEFVGRVPVRCALDPLSIDDLVAILDASEDVSPMNQWRDMFGAHGIDVTWDREALEVVALKAHAHGLGARSLVAELDLVFRDLAYELPGSFEGALHVDATTVEDPDAALARLTQQSMGIASAAGG